eukprot:m.19737 g.19737  ORF g.19737 m.19737 type:complete len:169 (+) comp6005_c0_seq1:381-887(+)
MGTNGDSSFCTSHTTMGSGFATTSPGEWCPTFLFDGVVANTPGRYAAAIIVAIIMGILNELIGYVRGRAEAGQPLFARPSGGPRVSKTFLSDVIFSLCYGGQMILAYWLMLLVMLFDIGIFFGVVGGLAMGNLINRRLKACYATPFSSQTTPLIQQAESHAPCCGGTS